MVTGQAGSEASSPHREVTDPSVEQEQCLTCWERDLQQPQTKLFML